MSLEHTRSQSDIYDEFISKLETHTPFGISTDMVLLEVVRAIYADVLKDNVVLRKEAYRTHAEGLDRIMTLGEAIFWFLKCFGEEEE